MLEGLLKSLACYLNEQPYACSKYIEMKCQELAYILTCYYPLHQISTFFYPISTYTESFQYFVMQNYDKVKNVEEFAHLGGYTTTTFRRLFKNMYGVPVYEWILDKKREGHFKRTCNTPSNVSPQSAPDTDSIHYHTLPISANDSFRRHPRSLRKRTANGENITIICKEHNKEQEDE